MSLLNDFVWITIGRLNKVKNQEYLISEFNLLQAEYPNTKLIITGDGPMKDTLLNQVSALKLNNKVIFTGNRTDIVNLLSASDAFVLSSINEGLPLSLQEAGSVGLPLVATNVGGCSEVVYDGENGYLCESDKRGALSEAMIRIISIKEDQRRMMGDKSREIVKNNYDISSVATKWHVLYG